MFTKEKDMIPVLRDKLSVVFDTDFFIEEFRSGNGIVDLVFTTNNFYNRKILDNLDFETVYFLTNFLNRKNKKRTFEMLSSESSLQKTKIKLILDYLLNSGYIKEKDDYYIVIEIYKAALADLISIEAKIKDWKKGFYQAMRYKYFSNMSFLAISTEYLHRVDLGLLKSNNVGLIAVSKDDVQLIYKPRKKCPTNRISFNYLCEYFISLFQTTCEKAL
ncbi:hypothetical protein KJ693_03965 [bacterium]|nr:hypothetical protein [bacterium]